MGGKLDTAQQQESPKEKAPIAPLKLSDVEEQLALVEGEEKKFKSMTDALVILNTDLDEIDRDELSDALDDVDGIDNPDYLSNLARLKTELGMRVDVELVDMLPPKLGGDPEHINRVIDLINELMAQEIKIFDLTQVIQSLSRHKYVKKAMEKNPDWVINRFVDREKISASEVRSYDQHLKEDGYEL